ncbi:MAG: 2-C-methyl-D-erythritol 4-phosphate cytidylyltransferase, partial [Atopobiaceae bacterium]|nr:2-C-methyl-D-erythritol 4-phosphate cytidylyltransferase [Atopobiaceae bacterium]
VIPCAEEVIAENRDVLKGKGYSPEKHIVIPGGSTRQESVFFGLEYLEEHFPATKRVIIHEAARPFVTVDDFRRLIDCGHSNAILGAPIPFTVLKHDSDQRIISGVLNRSELVNVQLPHIFDFPKLLEAHRMARAAGRLYTEDASLLFCEMGDEVAVLEGSELNIKVTYPSDYVISECLYRHYILGAGDPI